MNTVSLLPLLIAFTTAFRVPPVGELLALTPKVAGYNSIFALPNYAAMGSSDSAPPRVSMTYFLREVNGGYEWHHKRPTTKADSEHVNAADRNPTFTKFLWNADYKCFLFKLNRKVIWTTPELMMEYWGQKFFLTVAPGSLNTYYWIAKDSDRRDRYSATMFDMGGVGYIYDGKSHFVEYHASDGTRYDTGKALELWDMHDFKKKHEAEIIPPKPVVEPPPQAAGGESQGSPASDVKEATPEFHTPQGSPGSSIDQPVAEGPAHEQQAQEESHPVSKDQAAGEEHAKDQSAPGAFGKLKQNLGQRAKDLYNKLPALRRKKSEEGEQAQISEKPEEQQTPIDVSDLPAEEQHERPASGEAHAADQQSESGGGVSEAEVSPPHSDAGEPHPPLDQSGNETPREETSEGKPPAEEVPKEQPAPAPGRLQQLGQNVKNLGHKVYDKLPAIRRPDWMRWKKAEEPKKNEPAENNDQDKQKKGWLGGLFG